MTKDDVRKIFNVIDLIELDNGGIVTVDDFLEIAGFKKAPNKPTKKELHDIDKGIKGYADLIEKGNYNY